jgi:hypothetical protein
MKMYDRTVTVPRLLASVPREGIVEEMRRALSERYGEELVRTTAEARADADRIREEARAMLERARAEVASLASRREDITKQLGSLSGVIDALSVSERSEPDALAPEDAHHHPQAPAPKEEEHHQE